MPYDSSLSITVLRTMYGDHKRQRKRPHIKLKPSGHDLAWISRSLRFSECWQNRQNILRSSHNAYVERWSTTVVSIILKRLAVNCR